MLQIAIPAQNQLDSLRRLPQIVTAADLICYITK